MILIKQLITNDDNTCNDNIYINTHDRNTTTEMPRDILLHHDNDNTNY